ncbi:hypothetical protein EC973_004949 [Apophysomyces ossiformis]|uniref:UBX domain-containing protein n=1 Tax=Apophysomyces ossiformis TaxID=679940 RepID=A0A8H7BKR6_9FUNG|nr:hypothetical protein EC973_004949 [Apophysomyces ossiformis]
MENEQGVLDFCAVTGASLEVARNYLQIADGNVETAVTLYWESGEAAASQARETTTSTSSGSSAAHDADTVTSVTDEELARQIQEQERNVRQQDIRAPIAPKHDILSGGGPMFDQGRMWGARDRPQGRQQLSVFNQGDSSSASPGLDYIRGLGADPSTAAGRPSSSVRSPTEAAASAKAKRLADLFRPPFDIMFVGTFEEYSKESAEGKRYLTYYPIRSYPHVAVIDSRTGERVKVWENQMMPTDFTMEVTEFLEQQSPGSMKFNTMKRPKNISDMSEEEQINAAIAASLQSQGDTASEDNAVTSSVGAPTAPHEKKEGREKEIAEEEQEEEEEEKDETAQLSPLDSIQPIRRDEPTEIANTTRIQLRMADGKRIIRRFMKSDPVRYLFEFIKAEVPETQSQPFELVFNRKQLIDLLDQPIQEAGLENAAVNFVFT